MNKQKTKHLIDLEAFTTEQSLDWELGRYINPDSICLAISKDQLSDYCYTIIEHYKGFIKDIANGQSINSWVCREQERVKEEDRENDL